MNPATDLLKYIRFFSAVKDHVWLLETTDLPVPLVWYEFYVHREDFGIIRMYPDIIKREEVTIYAYRSKEDAGGDQ